jgi:hypothetical protein
LSVAKLDAIAPLAGGGVVLFVGEDLVPVVCCAGDGIAIELKYAGHAQHSAMLELFQPRDASQRA